jgi:hypothetical protein
MVSVLARGLPLRASAPYFDRGFAAPCARGAKAAMAGVLVAAAVFLCCLLSAAAPGRADPASTTAPAPSPGLVQPFEINRIVRDAGFSPLGPPKREGTTYVLRAIDSREILMRVVVDGRSGAIRAVNRIVAARPDGVVGMMPPPDGAPGPRRSLPGPPHEPLPGPPPGSPPRDTPPADAMPADISGPPMSPKEADLSMPPPPLTMRPGTRPAPLGAPPLPRPRPSNLTMQKAKPPGKVPKAPAVRPTAAPAAASVAPAAPRHAPTTPKGVPQIATPD